VSDIRIGIPKVSGEFDIPEPYNSNDYRVIKKFICKYLCQENYVFNRTNFLSLIKNDIYEIGAYPKAEIENSIGNIQKEINKLLYFCLSKLNDDGLVVINRLDHSNTEEYEEFRRSPVLELFCSKINEYDISIIEQLAKSIIIAVDEIQKEDNYKKIISFLVELEKQPIIIGDVKDIDDQILTKLNQLSVIQISFNNHIEISVIGRDSLLLLKQNEKNA
jgi:hypothetical protein